MWSLIKWFLLRAGVSTKYLKRIPEEKTICSFCVQSRNRSNEIPSNTDRKQKQEKCTIFWKPLKFRQQFWRKLFLDKEKGGGDQGVSNYSVSLIPLKIPALGKSSVLEGWNHKCFLSTTPPPDQIQPKVYVTDRPKLRTAAQHGTRSVTATLHGLGQKQLNFGQHPCLF